METIYDKIVRMAGDTSWSVSIEDESYVEFSTYTTFGNDFGFAIRIYRDDDLSDIIDRIKEYIDDFDVDYEAYLWIGADGHGKNGAPYHIKDIVSDMEDARDSMKKLVQAFEKSKQGTTY